MQQTMSAFRPRTLVTLAYIGGGDSLAPISFRQAGFGGGGMDLRDAIVKRAADIVLGTIGLMVTSIPMLLIATAIRLTSKGPALFRHAENNTRSAETAFPGGRRDRRSARGPRCA